MPIVWLALAMTAFAQSTWQRKVSNSSDYLAAVTHGSGTYVAVGENGTIVTSTDAITWSLASSGTTANLRSVIHSGGKFIATGSNGSLLTSPNGVTWTPRVTGTNVFLSGLAANGSIVVAVGPFGAILTSTDSVTWTANTPVSSAFLQHVHHAAGKFVACGSGGTVLTSSDGLTWSTFSAPTTAYLLGGGYFGGKHYLVGQNGVVLSSIDGISWSLGSAGTLNWLRAFTSDGSTAVISGGTDTEPGILLTSTDGTTWTPATTGQTAILAGATFADGRFVVVGEPVLDDGMLLVAEQDPGVRWREAESSIGEAAGSVTLTLDRIGSTSTVASIDYQTAAGSAAADDDFTSTSGTANFVVGQNSVEIQIPITNNPSAEPPEDFTVTLSNPAPPSLPLFPPTTATVTIIDAQDSDFDGLPDEWELTYFPSVGSFGATDDPDEDDNTNERELADGTDPSDPESVNYLLTLGIAGGLGSVAALPDLASYPKGTSVSVIPTGIGSYSFSSWHDGASGSSTPLTFEMTADLNIEAAFAITLEEALDAPGVTWTTGGSGPAWSGQDFDTFDGIDATTTGGLALFQQSSVETTVYGPASIEFDWKLSISAFDTLQFRIGGSTNAEISGSHDWEHRTATVGEGTWTLGWIYNRNSTVSGGTNEAWLDQVSLSYGYEEWQQFYFPGSTTEDPEEELSAPEDDADFDGLLNLFEYFHGLHPLVADSGSPSQPKVGFAEISGQTFPVLEWSQHRDRANYVSASIEYTTSLEIGNWQVLTAEPELLSTSGAIETYQISAPLPTAPRGFFRLRLTLLP